MHTHSKFLKIFSSRWCLRTIAILTIIVLYASFGMTTLADHPDHPEGTNVAEITADNSNAETECQAAADHFGYTDEEKARLIAFKLQDNVSSGGENIWTATNDEDGLFIMITGTAFEGGGFFGITEFDWSSNRSLDFVLAKGSNSFLAYHYDPEATFDSGLTFPIAGGSGGAATNSHITVCYDYELIVEKTADGSFDRTVTWDLEKTVSPDAYTGFIGDDFGPSTWVVDVTKNEVIDNYSVTGTITVTNPSPFAVTFAVTDVIDGTINVVVDCPTDELATVGSQGDSVVCTYTATGADGIDGTQQTNVATATVTNGAPVFGDDDEAPIVFTENLIGDDSVTVDDTRDTEGQFPVVISSSTTFDYDESFECSTILDNYEEQYYQETIENIATVKGVTTDLSDDANVVLDCYIPTVMKDATPEYEDFFDWDIFKSVDDDTFVGIPGDDYNFDFDVDIVLTTFETLNFSVSGDIEVNNPHPTLSLVVTLSDQIQATAFQGVISTSATCNFVAGELTVPADTTAVCGYTADMGNDLDDQIDATFTNLATVTLNEIDFSDTAPFSFGDVEPGEADGTEPSDVNVTDDNASESTGDDLTDGSFGDSSYDIFNDTADDTFGGECPTDLNEYPEGVFTFTRTNTAVIDETGEDASEDITVICYAPLVSKTAETTWDRDWTWDIDKTGPDPADGTLDLSDGQSYNADYEVTVTATLVDTFGVSGEITVINPGDSTMVVSLSDQLNDAAATVGAISSCVVEGHAAELWEADAAGAVSVPAGETAVCSYAGTPVDNDATLNIVSYTFGELQDTAEADVSYVLHADNITDECVDVGDTLYGDLGDICVTADDEGGNISYSGNAVPPATYDDTTSTFSYTIDLRDIAEVQEALCGEEVHIVNIADFITNDNEETGDDDHTVKVVHPCDGCSLTPGYWKTHSIFGPAPFDGAWYNGETAAYFAALDAAAKVKDPEAGSMPTILDSNGVAIPGVDGVETLMPGGWDYEITEGRGKDRVTVVTQVTYYYAMWTPPAGNKWFNLANHFAAAHLNIQNGADYSAIASEFVEAYELLAAVDPQGNINKQTRKQMTDLAGTLAAFNEGLIGPGHCDTDGS